MIATTVALLFQVGIFLIAFVVGSLLSELSAVEKKSEQADKINSALTVLFLIMLVLQFLVFGLLLSV